MTASKIVIAAIPKMDIKTSPSVSTFISDYLLKIYMNLRNLVENQDGWSYHLTYYR
jgi:hypothetical protein